MTLLIANWLATGVPLSTVIALLGLFVSLFSLYLTNRFQLLGTINSKLSDMAHQCDVDINLNEQIDDGQSIPAPLSIIETHQHISHAVSTIISARQLLKRTIKGNRLFFLGIAEQACIDKFYFQLQTSVREFIMDINRHPSFADKERDPDHGYHRMLQIKYCRNWLIKSYSKYGNATPKEILSGLERFKKIKLEEKMNELRRLATSEN